MSSTANQFNNKPSGLNITQADHNLLANSMASVGLYTRQEINQAKFSKYQRFGRVLDAHGRLNNTTEHLFFTKPDLHIVDPKSSQMVLNDELKAFPFFQDLVNLYPDVVRELQNSSPANPDPFGHLLPFMVNSNLELPSIESSVIETGQTVFGTSIEYMGNPESSDENISFSLEFIDSKELEGYQFFKAYQEYQLARKSGGVSPPTRAYTYRKKLHNVMGCYKFLIAEDMETIIHWSYLWGVFPVSAPREAFSDPTFPDGLTYSVNFKAKFIEDMSPLILKEFNHKMNTNIQGKKIIPIYELANPNEPGIGSVVGTLPSAAYIMQSGSAGGHDGRSKYKMVWYG